MNKFLKVILFFLFIKPLVYAGLGVNVRNGHLIRKDGPVILIANHNSHIDTFILMSLFSTSKIADIHPVAAKDYFLKGPLSTWFYMKILEIIPISREKTGSFHEHPLEEVSNKLKQGKIVILYPEGTRGEPEVMGEFKKGISHLSKMHPDVPIIPFYMCGPGKVWPKGEDILVPFVCDVFVGEPLYWQHSHSKFMEAVKNSFDALKLQHKQISA